MLTILYEASGAARLHEALRHFTGGKIVIFVSATPFRCPPAPYEAAPRAVIEAGLTDSTGYIPTHPQTMGVLANVEELETKLPGVYVLGDLAAIWCLNLKPLPKAGVFAEEQAAAVASNIASDIRGQEPKAVFNGEGVCYIEVGNGMAAEGSGKFYAYPAPRISINPPSIEGHKAKEEFEKLLTTWFV